VAVRGAGHLHAAQGGERGGAGARHHHQAQPGHSAARAQGVRGQGRRGARHRRGVDRAEEGRLFARRLRGGLSLDNQKLLSISIVNLKETKYYFLNLVKCSIMQHLMLDIKIFII